MMNGYRESDSLIVSRKSLNKMRDNKRMAEGTRTRRKKGRTLNRGTLQHAEMGQVSV